MGIALCIINTIVHTEKVVDGPVCNRRGHTKNYNKAIDWYMRWVNLVYETQKRMVTTLWEFWVKKCDLVAHEGVLGCW